MLGESSLSAPPPSTPPNAARAPEEVYASPHTFFRPPPSAALEIFNRPPSPDIGEIIRAMSGRSTEQHPPISSMSTLPYTSQGSSASGSGLPANGILQPAVNGNANRSQDGIVTQSMSTPVTPRATRLSTTSALTGPQYAVAPADGAMSFAVAGNLSGSPYTVHKTVKLGSKKGKGKATEMGAEQHLVSCLLDGPLFIGIGLQFGASPNEPIPRRRLDLNFMSFLSATMTRPKLTADPSFPTHFYRPIKISVRLAVV